MKYLFQKIYTVNKVFYIAENFFSQKTILKFDFVVLYGYLLFYNNTRSLHFIN